MSPRAFFDDTAACKMLVERDLLVVQQAFDRGRTVVVPADGIGTDLSRLPPSPPRKNYFFLGFGVGLIVRTIAVLLFEGDCAAFTDINLPVIALSPIFRGATLTTSFPGPLPAVSGKQLGNRSNGANHRGSS
jgi:hypothetical protein